MERIREIKIGFSAFIALLVLTISVQDSSANSGNSTRTTSIKPPSYEILIPGLSLAEPSPRPQATTSPKSVPGAQSSNSAVLSQHAMSEVTANCSLLSGSSATSVMPVGCNVSSVAEDSKEKIWTSAVIQRVATLVFCMICALVGNTAIILLLTCSRYRKRNSRVNIFIIHLAIGDLTVCFCTMTTEILFVAFGQWVLGPVLCKILPYLQCITLASTTFILTSMSFDRYLAICKPLKYRATTTRAKRFICVSWALAFVLAVPQLLIFVQTEETRDGRVYLQCKTKGYTALWQRRLYFSFFTVYIMIVPIILISFCYISIVCVVSKASRVIQRESYIPSTSGGGGSGGSGNAATGGATSNHRGSLSSRNSINSSMASHFNNNNCSTVSSVPLRRAGPQNRSKSTFPRAKIKTLKMTFTIIATFIICWTPYFVTTLIRVYSNYKVHVPEQVMAFVETITFIQSCVNPLIYGFFNIKVKRGVSECCPCGNAIRKGRDQVARVLRRNNSFHAQEVCMSVTQDPQHHVHRIHRPVFEMTLHNTPKPRHRAPDASLLGAGPSLCSGFGAGAGSLSGTSNSNPSHSQSANSVERIGRGGSSSVTVTENKNGVRLRVRFARRDNCRCMSSEGLNNSNVSDASMPYDLLLHTTNHGGAHTVDAQLTMYKHHSMQQLYT